MTAPDSATSNQNGGSPSPSAAWVEELESEHRKAHLHYKHELKNGGPNYKSEYRRGWRDAIKMLIAKRSSSTEKLSDR